MSDLQVSLTDIQHLNVWSLSTEGLLLIAWQLPNSRNLPYICDDNDVLTVPLVTEKVWKANFEGQIIKCVVLHFNWLKISIASVMGFWPLNDCSENRKAISMARL